MTAEEMQKETEKKIKNYPQQVYNYWSSNTAAIASAAAGVANTVASNNGGSGSGGALRWFIANWQLAIVGAVALYVLLKRL